eukprot:11884994-Heterocapsa_arctica.AAC.1
MPPCEAARWAAYLNKEFDEKFEMYYRAGGAHALRAVDVIPPVPGRWPGRQWSIVPPRSRLR